MERKEEKIKISKLCKYKKLSLLKDSIKNGDDKIVQLLLEELKTFSFYYFEYLIDKAVASKHYKVLEVLIENIQKTSNNKRDVFYCLCGLNDIERIKNYYHKYKIFINLKDVTPKKKKKKN